jgi:hypothetical protein
MGSIVLPAAAVTQDKYCMLLLMKPSAAGVTQQRMLLLLTLLQQQQNQVCRVHPTVAVAATLWPSPECSDAWLHVAHT